MHVVGTFSGDRKAYRTRSSTRSSAVINGEFIGLALDEENQPDQTEPRVAKWAKMIRLGVG